MARGRELHFSTGSGWRGGADSDAIFGFSRRLGLDAGWSGRCKKADKNSLKRLQLLVIQSDLL
jgi:hypothetical protein